MALACELGDEAVFQKFLAKNPDAASNIVVGGAAKTAQRRTEQQHQGSSTDAGGGLAGRYSRRDGSDDVIGSGLNGNAEMTREILRFHPGLELKSREYPGTALSMALYASGNGWHRDTGDFAGTVRALLEAGATLPPHAEDLQPSDAVLEVLP